MIENLSEQEIEGILEAIPLEIVFADKDDIVQFWNRHETRVLLKPPVSQIGKPVQDCHPKGSVHKVNQIISDIRSGRKESARFWMDYKERKYYYCYFPVRDKVGEYLGILETVQDITELRQLEGEKRYTDGY